MKPRDAATIFNDLEMPVLLQVVDRMKDAKAALVLAAMQPDKARDLTAKLAQLRIHRDDPGGTVRWLTTGRTQKGQADHADRQIHERPDRR